MIFIFIVHCAKEKKMNVKKCICTTSYERDVQRFGISCKNDGNCDIAVKERKSFHRYEIVKFWSKRQSGKGFVLAKSVIQLIKLQPQTTDIWFCHIRKILTTAAL